MSPRTHDRPAAARAPTLIAARARRRRRARACSTAASRRSPSSSRDGRYCRHLRRARVHQRACSPATSTSSSTPASSRARSRARSRSAPAAASNPSRDYMNTEHVDVGADFSDAQVAEIFLHHRVLLVPVVDDRRRHRRHHPQRLLQSPRRTRARGAAGICAVADASTASGDGQTMTGHRARRSRRVAGERLNPLAGEIECGRPTATNAASSAPASWARCRPTEPESTRVRQTRGATGAIAEAISSSIRRPSASRSASVAKSAGWGMPTAVAGNRRGGTT